MNRWNSYWLRALLLSVVLALVFGLLSAAVFDRIWAARYTTAALWTVGNFYLLDRLLRAMTLGSSRLRAAGWAVLKVPVWYAGGFWLVRHLGLEVTSFLAGFNTFFGVIVFQAAADYLRGQRVTRSPS